MIVSSYQLGQIRSNGEIVLDEALEVGSVHQVRTAKKRPVACEVKVLETYELKRGRVCNRLLVVWEPHTPRLLAARPYATNLDDGHQEVHGYTSQPMLAASGEPEAPPDTWQTEWSTQLGQRDHLLRLERVAAARAERWRRKRERKRAA